MTRESSGLHAQPFGDGAAALHLVWAADRPASLVGGAADAAPEDLAARAVQPLVEVLAVGHGRASANLRHTATAIGTRMRVDAVTVADEADDLQVVVVEQRDPVTGLVARTRLEVAPAAEGTAVRATTTVRNDGVAPLHLQAVASIALADPVGPVPAERTVSIEGTSEWVGENRWEQVPLDGPAGVLDLDLARHQHQVQRHPRAQRRAGHRRRHRRARLAGRAQRRLAGRGRRAAGCRGPPGAGARRARPHRHRPPLAAHPGPGRGVQHRPGHRDPGRRPVARRRRRAHGGPPSSGCPSWSSTTT
jgi:hypothetical protein